MSQYIPRKRLVREYQMQDVRKQHTQRLVTDDLATVDNPITAKVSEAKAILNANEPETAVEQDVKVEAVTNAVARCPFMPPDETL